MKKLFFVFLMIGSLLLAVDLYIPDRGETVTIDNGGMLVNGRSQDPNETSTTQNFMIGTRLRIGERAYRYGKFKTAVGDLSYAMVNGNIIPDDGAEVALGGTPAIGDKTIAVLDTGTTTRLVNHYQGGYVYLYRASTQSATDHDQLRRIIASTAGDGTSITFTLDYPLTATPSMTADCYPSPYSKICTPGSTYGSSGAEMFVGFAHAFHAAGGFGWVQTWGPVNGHYTGGGTEWPGNNGPNDRQIVFSIEGGLRTTKSSGTVVPLASQIAGYVIPCTKSDYGSVFCYLTVAE